ncbi:aspartate beta-hydroxylase domain-containing protein 1-like [Hyalella azteca]|uniref:Aspartate beta-hydroxylase domain-containing protein 1-like n=1 Tax=Hyalella azteca TaxID=294128 RepID=A0A8B7NXN3_HYAAZ|nr:aspartate beta-hydroxylase domain-containing protein 1-like [Hyalella azteca]
MDMISWSQTEINNTIMNLKNCCSSFIGMLPEPELQFLPAFILGMLVSSAVLVYLVQKDTKKSYKESFMIFIRQLFSAYEKDGSTERQINLQCMLDKASMRLNNTAIKCSDRLRNSVKDFVENSNEVDNMTSKNVCLRIEQLASHHFWNQFNAFDCEKEIILRNLPKIKEEFLKVFKDFQKGICKQWTKDEVLRGHSCHFSLISKGVINTVNCQACPNTFQTLSECRVMGLSGCMFGSASFTLLYPDSQVGPSCALTNALVKCEVVLQTSTAGDLQVASKKRKWQVDDILLYDASIPYTASLASSKDMTILATPLARLSLDLWHPDLLTPEREALAMLFSS